MRPESPRASALTHESRGSASFTRQPNTWHIVGGGKGRPEKGGWARASPGHLSGPISTLFSDLHSGIGRNVTNLPKNTSKSCPQRSHFLLKNRGTKGQKAPNEDQMDPKRNGRSNSYSISAYCAPGLLLRDFCISSHFIFTTIL